MAAPADTSRHLQTQVPDRHGPSRIAGREEPVACSSPGVLSMQHVGPEQKCVDLDAIAFQDGDRVTLG